jgi:hypothetical protein
MEYWKYNKTYGSAIFFQLSVVKNPACCLLLAGICVGSIYNPQSAIRNPQSQPPLPLSPFQLISENGEIVLLARLNQKERLRSLLYTDDIICL